MATSYRPSNGTEGEAFIGEFCCQCVKDRACNNADPDYANGCPILAATFACDESDPHYPKEWIEDELGPRCTAFERDLGQLYPDPHTLSEAEREAQFTLFKEKP